MKWSCDINDEDARLYLQEIEKSNEQILIEKVRSALEQIKELSQELSELDVEVFLVDAYEETNMLNTSDLEHAFIRAYQTKEI